MITYQGPSEVRYVDNGGQEHIVGVALTVEIEGTFFPATVEIEGTFFPATNDADGTTLHCGCCGLPWATVTPDGVLVVESRHGGRVHENRLSVAALAALASGNGATNGETWGYSG